MPFIDRDKPIAAEELTKICDFEADDTDYLDWKRKKIETALQQADEQPDNILTQSEVWEKHGLGN